MAIYHFNVRGISPARGSSAVASAAYQSGETLRDERTGDLKRYARQERIADTGLVLPEHAPEWDRQRLWNEAQRAHAGGNELVAKRYEFALPRELDLDEQRACVADFCLLFKGKACDWAIHDSGDGNPHAHVLVSSLDLGKDGFAPSKSKPQKSTKLYLCRDGEGHGFMVLASDWKAAKAAGLEKVYNFKDGERRTMTQAAADGMGKNDRKTKTPVAITVGMDTADEIKKNPKSASTIAKDKLDGARSFNAEKADLKRIRTSWANIANKHLAEHAAKHDEVAVTIDHRSFAAQKIDYIPTVHEGPKPVPERVAMNAEVRETNRAIDRVLAELRQLKARAGAWWSHKADELTQRRQAFIARHTDLMRSTAAKRRGMAMDRAAERGIARDVKTEIARVFSHRSDNHFKELAEALGKRGIDMAYADGKKSLKFSKDGVSVKCEEMGVPLRQLIRMSKQAGRTITANELRSMTAEQRQKLADERKAEQAEAKKNRPQFIEVELDETRGQNLDF